METDASAYDAGSVVSGVVRVKCAEAIRAKVRASSGASSGRPRRVSRPLRKSSSRLSIRRRVVALPSFDASPNPPSSPLTPSPLAPPLRFSQRVEVSVQGRERVTLQKTVGIPESELAPFHHLQGKSHKEHHAYLKLHPKPEVRDLVKERDWRLRNGHTSASKTVTLIEDVTQVERVFAERKVLLQLADDGELPPSPDALGPGGKGAFAVAVPNTAPSSFYVAGGSWSMGKGYLAEIVYVVSAAVVGDDYAGARSYPGADASASAAPSDFPELARGERLVASAKRHFLVTQKSPPGAFLPGAAMMSSSSMGTGGPSAPPPDIGGGGGGPAMTASASSAAAASPSASATRAFLTGGDVRASATLTDRWAFAPGEDCAVLRVEANNSSGSGCKKVTVAAQCALSLSADSARWAKTLELHPTRYPGFGPGYFGERWLSYRLPPGWPASTSGALVRCSYGLKVAFSLPNTLNLALDLPLAIRPTPSMYSEARPAGAPFAAPESSPAWGPPPPPAPPARLFRPTWRRDETAPGCERCRAPFTFLNRRHHCRHCGGVFCKKCAAAKVFLPRLGYGDAPQRVCEGCRDVAYATGGNFSPREEAREEGGASGESGGVGGAGAPPPVQDIAAFMAGERPGAAEQPGAGPGLEEGGSDATSAG